MSSSVALSASGAICVFDRKRFSLRLDKPLSYCDAWVSRWKASTQCRAPAILLPIFRNEHYACNSEHGRQHGKRNAPDR